MRFEVNCRTIHSNFDDRLDGRLAAADQQAFEAHLAQCPACRAQWQAYAAAWQTLSQHRAPEPSFGFVERTLRRLEEPEERLASAWWRPLVSRWATVASLVLVLGIGSWIGWRRYENNKQAQIYATVQETNFLGEDFDVIVSLDQLEKGNSL